MNILSLVSFVLIDILSCAFISQVLLQSFVFKQDCILQYPTEQLIPPSLIDYISVCLSLMSHILIYSLIPRPPSFPSPAVQKGDFSFAHGVSLGMRLTNMYVYTKLRKKKNRNGLSSTNQGFSIKSFASSAITEGKS